MERMGRLRARHEERTAAMLRFLEDEGSCKGQAVQRYFGEAAQERCGHCSTCRKAAAKVPPEKDLKEALLAAVSNAPEAVGLRLLTSRFPPEAQAAVVALLRRMVERGEVIWHPDNSFSLPKKKIR